MVSPVDRIIPDFAAAGASYISFHPEATQHIDRTIEHIREQGCRPGLVFNPATPLDYLDYTLEKLDLVLIMSVNPGFGGQKFIPTALRKLAEARRRIDASGRDVRLEIDGGVKVENIRRHRARGRGYLRSGVGDLRQRGLRRDHQGHARADRGRLSEATAADDSLVVVLIIVVIEIRRRHRLSHGLSRQAR